MIQGAPNLDDRSFEDLLEESRAWIQRKCPEWNDLSPGDPGMILLEVFSHITEVMLYRLNRLPDKAYVAFLNFLGMEMRSSAAAGVMLKFEREESDEFLEIPKGTRVQSTIVRDGETLAVFATTQRAVFEPGQQTVQVEARAGAWVEGELLGVASGLPGQSFRVSSPPIVCPVPNAEDLIIAVEVKGENPDRTLSWAGTAFEVWDEVASFASLGNAQKVYTVDRLNGSVVFAPAVSGLNGNGPDQYGALAAIPGNGREVRAWYRRGGGRETNVPAGALTILKDALTGVSVTNPSAATGGVNAESLENALMRAPQQFRTLDRAVTAADYELLARQGSPAVGRAKAFTQTDIWAHAKPGTVELLLVPNVPEEMRDDQVGLTAAYLNSLQTDDALASVQEHIDQCKTIGASCRIKWTRYKPVSVRGRVVVRQAEDTASVYKRLIECLNRKISVLPNSRNPEGWSYGSPLHVSSIYDTLLSEPGIVFVDQVRLVVDDAPDIGVHGLEADAFQKDTWYAGEDEKLFRSSNNGEGWEIIRSFDVGEKIIRIKVHPEQPGMMAVVSEIGEEDSERREWLLHVTYDCGESWDFAGRLQFQVRDCAWIQEGGGQHLLLATDQGLYKIQAGAGGIPMPVVVDPEKPTMKLWNVETALSEEGGQIIALAAQDQGGVYLSVAGTREHAFRNMGLQDADVRVLQIQRQGPNCFLWAGRFTFGASEGDGCSRLPIPREMGGEVYWDHFNSDWRGGSCRDLACTGTHVFAATHHAGVLELNTVQREPVWEVPKIDCGLGLRDVGRFHPVFAVASRSVDHGFSMMAAGPVGVFRRHPDSPEYDNTSCVEFDSRITLPRTWQFCPGKHKLEVLRENEIR